MEGNNKIKKIIDLDLYIKKYKETISEKEVPTDLWLNIKRELLKSKNKLKMSLIKELFKILYKNKISYVAYAIIIISFFIFVLFQNYNKNNEKEIKRTIVINKIDNNQLSVEQKNSKSLLLQGKKSKHKIININNEINKLEKKVNKILLTKDEYSKIFYENSINEINNSINECKDIYNKEKNQIVKQTLNNIYDKKIRLLFEILNQN